jgi:carboxyl-terminal processing protease
LIIIHNFNIIEPMERKGQVLDQHSMFSPEDWIAPVLDDIERYSIRGIGVNIPSLKLDKMDWNAYRLEVISRIDPLSHVSPESMLPLVKEALDRLGDKHSCIIANKNGSTPELAQDFFTSSVFADIRGQLLGEVGYINVPELVSFNPSILVKYATKMQEMIENVTAQGAKNWVVDLRGNKGGDMWSMLAGLGPIMGNGTHGNFIFSKGEKISWGYENGVSMAGGCSCVAVEKPFALPNKPSFIAVLIDENTASSGEALCIALKGLPNVTTYGQATAGLTTSNTVFDLPAGIGRFALATSVMADRNGCPFGGRLNPDVCMSPTEKKLNPLEDDLVSGVLFKTPKKHYPIAFPSFS